MSDLLTDKRVLAHQWYGQIFQDWTLTRLSYFCTRNNIKNTDLKESNLLSLSFGEVVRKDIEQQEGLLPESFEGYQIVESGNIIVRLLDLQNDHKSLRSALVRERGIITSAYVGLIVDSTIAEPRFVNYSLRAMDQSKYLYSLGAGVRQTLKADEFLELPIPLPDLATQRRIADRLDRETGEIDSLVKELDEYVGLLERRKQKALSTLFGKYSHETPIYAHFSILNGDRGSSYPAAEEIQDSGIPFVNAGDLSGLMVSMKNMKYVSVEKYASMGGAKLRAGDVIFCLRGTIGKHGYVDFKDGSLASSVCVLRNHKSHSYLPELLNFAMELPQFKQSLKFVENGSAQPNLSGEALVRCRIPSVPLSEQAGLIVEIQKEFAHSDALVTECMALKKLLLKRRQVLITDMVTGKVEV